MQKVKKDSIHRVFIGKDLKPFQKGSIGRLLVVGWDGADPDIVDALCSCGKLPHLQSLRRRGVWGRLTSTYPPSSLPAWTSVLTGVGPGEHGVVHYIRKDSHGYRLRLVNAHEREVTTIQRIATQNGFKVASLGVPGSFPPDDLSGLCIAGFDSPFALRAGRQAYHPPELYDMLDRNGLGWPYGDMDESAVGPGWHAEARKVLLSTMQEKCKTAEFVLTDLGPFDMFMVVFSETDTAAHHFWALHDKLSPRYRFDAALGGTLQEVYMGLDRCLGRLLQHTDDQCLVVVLSDHGFCGASDTVVSINRWLHAQGYLHFGGHGSVLQRAAGLLGKLGGRLAPAWIKQVILRSSLSDLIMRADASGRFGGLDLPATQAFSDELPQFPGIWIHLKGRDPFGVVEPGFEYENLRQQIIDTLPQTCCNEQGAKLVSKVLRREEVMPGPFMERAADLLVELARIDGYGVLSEQSGGRPGPVCRKLSGREKIGSKGLGVSGIHRSEGMLAMAGLGFGANGHRIDLNVENVFSILAACLGLEAEDRGGVCAERFCRRDIASYQRIFSDADENQSDLRKRLENLGYL